MKIKTCPIKKRCGNYGNCDDCGIGVYVQIMDIKSAIRKITAERDAAIKDLEDAMARVDRIRTSSLCEGEIDDALGDLCGVYCKAYGVNCFKDAGNGHCAHFVWRGCRHGTSDGD